MLKGMEYGKDFIWEDSKYRSETIDVTFIRQDYPNVLIKTQHGSLIIPYDALYDFVTDQLRQKLEYQMTGLSPEEMIKRIVK